MDYPDSSELTSIYSAYLQGALQPGPQVLVHMVIDRDGHR
jgi:hypothetical protein